MKIALSYIVYIYMVLYIGVYVCYQHAGSCLPESFRSIHTAVCWGFLIWSGITAGKIIADCLLLFMKNQMTAGNTWSGIALAVWHILPVVLMAMFMLREGFKG